MCQMKGQKRNLGIFVVFSFQVEHSYIEWLKYVALRLRASKRFSVKYIVVFKFNLSTKTGLNLTSPSISMHRQVFCKEDL